MSYGSSRSFLFTANTNSILLRIAVRDNFSMSFVRSFRFTL